MSAVLLLGGTASKLFFTEKPSLLPMFFPNSRASCLPTCVVLVPFLNPCKTPLLLARGDIFPPLVFKVSILGVDLYPLFPTRTSPSLFSFLLPEDWSFYPLTAEVFFLFCTGRVTTFNVPLCNLFFLLLRVSFSAHPLTPHTLPGWFMFFWARAGILELPL